MVQLLQKIKNTAGGFHSWWESDMGIIRKPNSKIFLHFEPKPKIEKIEEIPKKKSWFQKFLEWIKKILIANGYIVSKP